MDTLGNLITIIKNAALAHKKGISAPWSKSSEAICRLLETQKYLTDVKIIDAKTKNGSKIKRISFEIAITDSGAPMLTDIKRVSRPGRRQTANSKKLPRVLKGYGFAIVSTPQGILTSIEAQKQHHGGEIICLVW